jgi:hypothetical protein
MMKNRLILVKLSIVFLLNIIITPVNKAYSQDENLDALVSDTKNDLMMVVGGGLAGAVLGLSTLSFAETPKDHTKNIIVGASIGIIVGVGFVAFTQANKSRDMIYGTEGNMEEAQAYKSGKSFGTFARNAWHSNTTSEHTQLIHSPYGVGYSFTY